MGNTWLLDIFENLANSLRQENEVYGKSSLSLPTAIDFFDIDICIFKWHEWKILSAPINVYGIFLSYFWNFQLADEFLMPRFSVY